MSRKTQKLRQVNLPPYKYLPLVDKVSRSILVSRLLLFFFFILFSVEVIQAEVDRLVFLQTTQVPQPLNSHLHHGQVVYQSKI
jgi:hypothetical protein